MAWGLSPGCWLSALLCTSLSAPWVTAPDPGRGPALPPRRYTPAGSTFGAQSGLGEKAPFSPAPPSPGFPCRRAQTATRCGNSTLSLEAAWDLLAKCVPPAAGPGHPALLCLSTCSSTPESVAPPPQASQATREAHWPTGPGPHSSGQPPSSLEAAPALSQHEVRRKGSAKASVRPPRCGFLASLPFPLSIHVKRNGGCQHIPGLDTPSSKERFSRAGGCDGPGKCFHSTSASRGAEEVGGGGL